MVVRHGSVVAERWWHPYGADTPHLLYSLSKSFTSTALGFAVTEGRIDLDATVLSYFPEFDAQITDPAIASDEGAARGVDGQRARRGDRPGGVGAR